MGVNIRTVGAVAVTTLLALLGLVWFQRRKRENTGSTRNVESTDNTEKVLSATSTECEGALDDGDASDHCKLEQNPEDGTGDDVTAVTATAATAAGVTAAHDVQETLVAQNTGSYVESTQQELADLGEAVVEELCVSQTSLIQDKTPVLKDSFPDTSSDDRHSSSFTANAETDIKQSAEKVASSSHKIKVVSASSLRSRANNSSTELQQADFAPVGSAVDDENSDPKVSHTSCVETNDSRETSNESLPSLEVTGASVVSGQLASPVDDLGSTSSHSDHSEVSCDSGKGISIGQIDDSNDTSAVDSVISEIEPIVLQEFEFPSDLCGLLIGRKGRNITEMKNKSGANISLSELPYTQSYQKCTVKGSQCAVDEAVRLIQSRFGSDVDVNRKVKNQNQMMIPNETMQLSLPEGVSVDVIVSSIVSGGHLFVQQMTHPTFPSLERLNQCMLTCYSQLQDVIVPQLPRPIEVGVICAAPMMNGWYRAQVVNTLEETDECYVRYVDYGGYTLVAASQLKQIRSDFMSLPFQAVEGYLANVSHLQGESEFSLESAAIVEELTQGYVLKCQIFGYAEDGIPYLQLYNVIGGRTSIVNRELVNRGVARWLEEQ